jgi:hypothetical protein
VPDGRKGVKFDAFSSVKHGSSAKVHAAGPDLLRRLWDAFALSDEQLADVLGGRLRPAASQWLASWDAGSY